MHANVLPSLFYASLHQRPLKPFVHILRLCFRNSSEVIGLTFFIICKAGIHGVNQASHNIIGIGVILTGMGADGAVGILRMRKNGACTIGQDEASSSSSKKQTFPNRSQEASNYHKNSTLNVTP